MNDLEFPFKMSYISWNTLYSVLSVIINEVPFYTEAECNRTSVRSSLPLVSSPLLFVPEKSYTSTASAQGGAANSQGNIEHVRVWVASELWNGRRDENGRAHRHVERRKYIVVTLCGTRNSTVFNGAWKCNFGIDTKRDRHSCRVVGTY
jgi:hypothetical protein